MSSTDTDTWLPSLRALPEPGATLPAASVEHAPSKDPQAVGVVGPRASANVPTTVTTRYPLVIGAELRGSRLRRGAGPSLKLPKRLPHLGRRGPKPTAP
ncbi:MAG TPA: hypothetical protein VMU63_00725 [Acidimicrobiales bacterium]|nr:hypothetical protein [Acidimicrobiales bacterium]